MGSYTKVNLRRDVEDSAPRFEMPSGMQARFARRPIGGTTLGLSLFTLEPGFRIPFGHEHAQQEEVYVILRGSARIKVGDDIVDVTEGDAVRFDVDTMRAVEAGPEGVEYVAFGAGEDPMDAITDPGFWPVEGASS